MVRVPFRFVKTPTKIKKEEGEDSRKDRKEAQSVAPVAPIVIRKELQSSSTPKPSVAKRTLGRVGNKSRTPTGLHMRRRGRQLSVVSFQLEVAMVKGGRTFLPVKPGGGSVIAFKRRVGKPALRYPNLLLLALLCDLCESLFHSPSPSR